LLFLWEFSPRFVNFEVILDCLVSPDGDREINSCGRQGGGHESVSFCNDPKSKVTSDDLRDSFISDQKIDGEEFDN